MESIVHPPKSCTKPKILQLTAGKLLNFTKKPHLICSKIIAKRLLQTLIKITLLSHGFFKMVSNKQFFDADFFYRNQISNLQIKILQQRPLWLLHDKWSQSKCQSSLEQIPNTATDIVVRKNRRRQREVLMCQINECFFIWVAVTWKGFGIIWQLALSLTIEMCTK